MDDDIVFSDNPDRQRFELRKGGQLAGFAEYTPQAGALRLVHTEVLPAFEGQGLGSKLARGVLEELRRRQVKAVPQCPFIAGYIGKHAEYQDLVAR